MTAARQERKAPAGPGRRLRPSQHVLGVLLAAFVAPLPPAPARAATTELIVTERHTGLAISGFDPVAYFTEGAAKLGRAGFELRQAGVTWRFRNEGNRAAFVANPEVFAPRFGGYDPVAVARGASTAGHPQVWLVVDDRLYLFHSDAARAAFKQDHERAVHAAERRWPEVVRTLSP